MARKGWFGHRAQPSDDFSDQIATKCEDCSAIIFAREFERNQKVCSKCGHHHRLSASERIAMTVDEGTFEEMDRGIVSKDPLKFPGYAAKVQAARASTGLDDAIVTGTAQIEGFPCVLGIADFAFIGGSMGSVVGEKIVRAMEAGLEKRLPVIMFAASGGARMHEGLLALMQMAKTSASAGRLDRARIPYIVVLTHPTTGGVYASYAMLGDVNLAEPGATVGFAGLRVGNQDLGGKLPDNFQTSEFQREHGMVDRIVSRKEMKTALGFLLGFFAEEAIDAA